VIDERPPAAGRGGSWGLIASILRAGTVIAVGTVAIGLVWATLAGTPASTDLTVVELIAAGGPDALVAAGLLGLTLVPIAALAAAASVFLRLGERRPLLVTGAVLILLGASLVASVIIGAAG
jgi:hypothetical protein